MKNKLLCFFANKRPNWKLHREYEHCFRTIARLVFIPPMFANGHGQSNTLIDIIIPTKHPGHKEHGINIQNISSLQCALVLTKVQQTTIVFWFHLMQGLICIHYGGWFVPFRLFVISRRHNEGAITKRRKDESEKTKRRKRKDEKTK